MTDRDDNRTEREKDRPQTIVVPGSAGDDEEPGEDDLVDEAQRARDLGAASRSCIAILAVLAVMALMLCIFLLWAAFLQ